MGNGNRRGVIEFWQTCRNYGYAAASVYVFMHFTYEYDSYFYKLEKRFTCVWNM